MTVRSVIAVGLAGIVVALIALAVLLFLGNTGDVEVRLGDDVFYAGRVERIADEIADRGPITYANPGGEARPIYLQHIGDDPETGWSAFEARVPGQPDCLVQWSVTEGAFVDQCDVTNTYPPSGEGLTTITVLVEDGEVIVDLNDVRGE